MKIRIGSRGSDLALWQANHVKDALTKAGAAVEIIIYKTQGDKIQHLSLDKLEGKGFFTKELEDALLNNQIDLAVHSHKDLPTVSPEGLCIAAVSDREDPSELLLIRKEKYDPSQPYFLAPHSLVGSSSGRRKAQLRLSAPALVLKDIRGNVPTRIQKLREGQFDAILLAKAGVNRLKIDLSEFECLALDPTEFIPAPAQGVLALQTRDQDQALIQYIKSHFHQESVDQKIAIERKILNLFEGGCHMPLGAYVEKIDGTLHLWASMAKHEFEKPRRLHLQHNNTSGLAEKAVQLLKQGILAGKKVFITQEEKLNSFFDQQLEAEAAICIRQSGIKIEPIDFEFDANGFDLIFFNSKNAVAHFFDRQPNLHGKMQYACFGKGTAQELRKHVPSISFVGNSSDPNLVAENFSSQFTDRNLRIAFPTAMKSLQSVSTILSAKYLVQEISVYQTTSLTQLSIPEVDAIVLTSLSNVDAYNDALANINPQTLIIAIGPSTANHLKTKGFRCDGVATRADDYGIFDALYRSFAEKL